MESPQQPEPHSMSIEHETESPAGTQLLQQLRDFLDRTADSLTAAYRAADNASSNNQSQTAGFDNPWDFYDSEKEQILNHREINYWVEGTGRTVAVIGSTFDGDLLYPDQRGVVVKFQPILGLEAAKYRSERGEAMNEHEIRTWNIALERGDTDLFADIIDHSESAHWLAMEQCLPISTSGPAHDEPSHNHIIDKPEKNLINSFRKRFSNRGWYEHDFKHGNIGKNSDGNTVLLDYGSFTEHRSTRND